MVKRVAILTEDLYEDVSFGIRSIGSKKQDMRSWSIGSGRKVSFTGVHGLPNEVDMAISSADPGSSMRSSCPEDMPLTR